MPQEVSFLILYLIYSSGQKVAANKVLISFRVVLFMVGSSPALASLENPLKGIQLNVISITEENKPF